MIYEYKQSIKTNDNQNALFSHMLELKHTFNFSQATLIKPIQCKKYQRLLESAVISKTNHIKQRPGFYQISPYLANMILSENKIKVQFKCQTVLFDPLIGPDQVQEWT